MALIPAGSLLPCVRERIPRVYRRAGLVVPFSLFVIYGATMIAASMFSAYGERPGSWSGLLMPIVIVAPLATLAGAGAIAALSTRRRRTLYLAIGGLVAVIASLVIVVALIRSSILCA